MRRPVRALQDFRGHFRGHFGSRNGGRRPDPWRPGILAALGIGAGVVVTLCGVGACKSTPEKVVDAPECSDPCCAGNLELVDCSQNPSLSCTGPGDTCTAQVYGCDAGFFFMHAPTTVPASCNDAEAGATTGDDGSLVFGGGDDSGDDSSSADGAANDGSPGATADGGTGDGPVDAGP
jgi:hypothetical protein